MKKLLMREAAFLIAPVVVMTSLFRLLAFLFLLVEIVAMSEALAWALAIFVVDPAWYEWIGVAILLTISFVIIRLAFVGQGKP
jgi:hypothetical protein